MRLFEHGQISTSFKFIPSAIFFYTSKEEIKLNYDALEESNLLKYAEAIYEGLYLGQC